MELLFAGVDDYAALAEKTRKVLKEQGLQPSLSETKTYCRKEAEILFAQGFTAEDVEKAQAYVVMRAEERDCVKHSVSVGEEV